MCLIYTIQYFKELYKMLMYFICKAVDMAPQPIRCLWSGDNKHLNKKKKKGLQFDVYQSDFLFFSVGDHLVFLRHFWRLSRAPKLSNF